MKIIVRISAVLLFLICLFPPWVQTDYHGVVRGSEPLGYHFLFSPPQPKYQHANGSFYAWQNFQPDIENNDSSFSRMGISIKPDLVRLFIEIIGLSALVGLVFTFELSKGKTR